MPEPSGSRSRVGLGSIALYCVLPAALAAGVASSPSHPRTVETRQDASGPADAPQGPPSAQDPSDRRAEEAARGDAQARALCGTCHPVPPPDILPRNAWRDNVARMYLLVTGQPEPVGPPGTAARMVALPPEYQAIARYYESAAPERLPTAEPWPPIDRTLSFDRRLLTPAGAPPTPAVAHVRFVDLDGDGTSELVASEMRYGLLLKSRLTAAKPELEIIGRVPNPAHVEPLDLDNDGRTDFLIGDLGSYLPEDHDKGSVVWLRGKADGTFEQMRLTGWPRVSDVRASDFDGDGRQDLAVAAFGWRKTGDLTILRATSPGFGQKAFEAVVIDPRHGAIHAPPVDLNGDKRPDLVVLFAQEHEAVVAFLNTGKGLAFDPKPIYAGPHPNWGSSGIEVVDLDKDGDLDVLLTHGDTFDDDIVKPYHGIIWLENKGTYPFTEHPLATMPGVHRAQAADLDNDGDLDIVACALLSAGPEETKDLASIVWLEQVKPGMFERRTLETGLPNHATLDAADYDGDGDVDLAIGNFSEAGVGMKSWVEIWVNRLK